MGISETRETNLSVRNYIEKSVETFVLFQKIFPIMKTKRKKKKSSFYGMKNTKS